jgi:aryl-alcohol dehydrogenase-like predicted oxidoreductase
MSEVVDVIQFPFNVLDNRGQRGALMQRAKERLKELHARSVYLQGLFFQSPDEVPPKLLPLVPFLRLIRDLAHEFAISTHALALNYVLHNPLLDGVLFGVETLGQLKENLDAIMTVFPEDVTRRIEEIRVEEIDLLNPVHWHT